MELFEKYSYSPYDQTDRPNIDDVVDRDDYERLYNLFAPKIKLLDRKLKSEFFVNYNFSSHDTELINPKRLIFGLFVKTLILQKIERLHADERIDLTATKQELDFLKSAACGLTTKRFCNQYAMIVKYLGDPFTVKEVNGKKQFDSPVDTTEKNKILRLLPKAPGEIFHRAKCNLFGNFNDKHRVLLFGRNLLVDEIKVELSRKKVGTKDITKAINRTYFNARVPENLFESTTAEIKSKIRGELSCGECNLQDLGVLSE